MLTVEQLRKWGANVDEALVRCLNNEAFYLKMVAMTLADGNFDALKTAMDAGDISRAFAAAHSLKGTTGNVALTPIYEPICALTELLRGKDAPAEGGDALLEQIMTAREKALRL